MLVKFKGPSGLPYADIYINSDFVSSIGHHMHWVGESKKHFHVAGHVLVEYGIATTDGDRPFNIVLGTLDEVAAALNGGRS
jgi:hypothetical protein